MSVGTDRLIPAKKNDGLQFALVSTLCDSKLHMGVKFESCF